MDAAVYFVEKSGNLRGSEGRAEQSMHGHDVITLIRTLGEINGKSSSNVTDEVRPRLAPLLAV